MINRICIIFLVLLGCSKDVEPEEPSSNSPFNLVDPAVSGLEFSNDLFPKNNLNIIEYLYYYNGGGVAVGDINNDGLDDIYLSANQKPDKLFLNLGGLKFKDISTESGISMDSTWSTGVTMVDINDDGLMDIYVCKLGNYKGLSASNELYINKGNNTFEEKAKAFGLDFSGFSTQASFFDYDNDGDMDLYLLNHSVHSTHSYGNSSLRSKVDSLSGDILFENKSDGKDIVFTNVTQQAGIYSSPLGYGLALTTSDVNNDGFTDIYVGNDFHENDYLYINNGDKTFTESSAEYFNHTSRFTMGVDIGDLDNDGLLDIITLDMMPFQSDVFLKSGGEDSDKVDQIKKTFGYQQQYARNHLHLNKESHFEEAARIAGVHATDWSWAPLIFDYNNDGLNDLYITNGIYKRPNDLDYINYLSNVDFARYEETKHDSIEQILINAMPSLKLANALYQNKGQLKFERLESDNKNLTTYSNGAAYSDLDRDGDLDVVVNNLNQVASLLENESSTNNYLTIELQGKEKSLNTTGAKVFVYSDSLSFYKEQTTVRGFQSSSTRSIHFGLANLKKIDSIVVIWNNATKTTIRDVDINSIISIAQENTKPYQYQTINNEEFVKFDYQHQENPYLDYEYEGLIPEKLSTEGPSLVQADFNADGLLDLFIGGASGQAPSLFLQDSGGDFKLKKLTVFENDAKYEDVDAIALDMDSDGDLDIYALSGGNQFEEGNLLLEDRVYLNDGSGNFTKLQSKLLATNGGSVSSFDYNNDNLPDLFIGNRSLAGNYGLTPFSIILKNIGNNNFEIVAKARYGMITDSQWTDLDNDGKVELVMAGDWMPITVLSYIGEDKFENRTEAFGLEKSNGMWNVIKFGDLNGDGLMDIVAGNTGLNFKWKASIDRPVTMYLDDFDNNSQLDQLIFYDFFGTYVPFASKDKIMQQMPILKKKFLSYGEFAKVSSLKELVNREPNDILETKNIYELRSMAYINNGKTFTNMELPKAAQLSTIEDILLDEDKIVFTGNYLGFVTELGENSSNSGGVIKFHKDSLIYKGNLSLPKYFSGRKIIELNENKYLVIANDGNSYIVDKIKKDTSEALYK